ncbi:alpha/beta fold hydrolase [Streptomyces sp. 8K308]|uniref:alpha/beta fold hydrolase n=1 Tax=Streptomyces sp. 8K308 TaxID=2530388 RepID=UPI0010498AC7|nr:alpha/beta fold hydrolase [Streptomyces sp. 8K308]TDC26662.1 alpha/beta fold hydrolase [Streptomyces sp. 8K308]
MSSEVTVNGITVGYEDTGAYRADLAPLVLVHGHPFDRSMWAPQLAAVAATGRRVIAPDLRGYGESTVVPGVVTLTDHARDIAALLDALGVKRPVLGGLSMGGQIVMEFQRLFPGRAAGLVLADTSAAAETEDGKTWRRALADRLLAEGMDGYAHEALPRMMAPYNVQALPSVAAHVLRMMRGTHPEGAAAALRGRALRPDYRATLAGVAVPTLVLVGADDEFTPVIDAQDIKVRVAGARLAVIPGAGHLPNLERPADVDAALADFLATLPTPVAAQPSTGNS